MFKKRKNLTIIAVVVICFGFSFLMYGTSFIFESGITPENISDAEKLGILTTLNMMGDKKENDSTKHIKINFETLEVFAGDTIQITGDASSASQNLKSIILIIADPDFYFGDDNGRIFRVLESFPTENIIELFPNTEPPFYASKPVKFFRPDQEVVIYAISFGEQQTIAKYKSEVVFTVHSQVDKLQVQTNNAILKSVNEQEKTNLIFLGLAWIGVAVIPILAGVDILLRIHFDD